MSKQNTKNNKGKKQETNYNDFTLPFDIQQYTTDIINKSNNLGKQYQDFKYKRNDWRYTTNGELDAFNQWLPFYQQACDIDLLKGELEFAQLSAKQSLSYAPTIEHFFKSYNFFSNHVWPARFASRLVGKYVNCSLDMKKYFVGLVSKLLNGFIFDTTTEVLTISETPSYTKFFSTMIGKSDRYLIWMVGVERIPKLSSNRQTVVKFDYIHYMRFLDIVHGKEVSRDNHFSLCSRTIYDFRRDPARQDFGNLETIYNRAALFQPVETVTGSVPDFIEYRVANAKYTPNRFKPVPLSEREKSSIVFDTRNQRWRTGFQAGMLDHEQYNDYLRKLNDDTIKDKANFKNASQIVEFLKKIPNFRIKLTEEQNEVVGQSENVVALGRSGTGKTTCAILRLFAMEILFKFRMTVARIKHEGLIRDSKFAAEDIDNVYGLHCAFVTASPVLSNEVQRYYHRLTTQVKDELKNKQKRILEKKREQEQQKREQELKNQQQGEAQNKEGQNGEIQENKEGNAQDEAEVKIQQQAQEAVEALQLAEEGIQGIKIDEMDLENEDQDIVDEEEADDEIIKKMQKINSLRHVKEDSFPLFLTVKRLVLLIDGCLHKPFFARNIKDQILGLDSNAQWHNEMKGVMMIGNYHRKVKNFDKAMQKAEKEQQDSDISSSESEESDEEVDEDEFKAEYRREINLQAHAKNKRDQAHNLRSNHYKLSFEVEYEYFLNYFWTPIILKRAPNIDVHPIVVWSEIQSHIKGSANSHLYPGYYLPERIYYSMDSQKKNFLTREKKMTIFDIFGRYERWKRDIGAYDFMDVVNYILNYIRYYGYPGVPIHYLMIDEVQDLTHASILLFMKITNMGLFFSGDTAQTIAKGVGLRFSDLKSLFKIQEEMYYNNYYRQTWKQPIIKQLTVNFRSHGKILELANSVVTVIETFFPRTIDKLKKEKSDIDGPKPILLADLDLDVLFTLLFGTENYKSERHSDNKGSIVSSQVEFGCNQVIIVRDQESKEKLPPLLKHALVLTVYEAKVKFSMNYGLEFDDVILYNFFADSNITNNQWRLLDTLSIQDIMLDEFEYNQKFFTFAKEKKQKKPAEEKKEEKKEEKEKNKENDAEGDDEEEDGEGEAEELNQDSVQLFNSSLDVTTRMYTIKKVISSINRKNFDIGPYSMLCNELKQLYVAITRPKNRLVIYDDSIQNRKYVENYWRKLDLVEVISKKDLDTSMEFNNKEIASFRALVTKTNAVEWKKQGVRMFKNKYYEQAIKCFEKSGDEDFRLRAIAYDAAEKASSKMSDFNAKRMYIQEGVYPYSTYSKAQKKAALKDLKHKTGDIRQDFLRAGQTFEQIGLLKQAAQCYFSAEKFKKALVAYEKIGYSKQAAEAAFMMKDYEKAADYYDKGGDYIRAIECLAEVKQYEKILELVNKYKDMPVEQREKFAKKYVPLALKALVVNIDYNIEDLEEKRKEEVKAKLSKQNQGIKIEEVSEEDEEDDEDEEYSEEEEEEDEDEENKKEKENGEKEEEEEKEGEKKEENGKQIDVEDGQEINQEEPKTEQKEEGVNQNGEQENKGADLSNMEFSEVQGDKSEKSKMVSKDSNKNMSEMSFEVVNSENKSKDVSIVSFNEESIKPKDFKTKQDGGDVENISFEDVGSVNTKANIKENLEDFDHLSHIDPEDEWLRMETGSIVEKLSAIRKQDSASYSDYSAVDFNHVMNNQCVLVNTKTDIFVQDAIMQKIIRYIGMFSDDVKQSLGRVRSKKTLLSQKSPDQMGDDSVIDLMVDLDEISNEFIYLILDLLEHYKLYKLCIFVCNRYGLSQKLGRYLVNIASRYSNFANESIIVNKIKLLNSVQRQIQNEKAFIANIAFHNVLENINPIFLRLKRKGEKVDFSNSLGYECFSELLNLGFWKKCMFLMDYDNSLALASTFASFKNYKLIYLKENDAYKIDNINALLANENFEFLPFKTPSSSEEIKCCFVALESVLWDLTEKFPIYLQRDNLTINTEMRLEIPPFASFFAFNGILWNYIYHKNSENARLFENYLSDALTNLSKILKNTDFKSPIIELRIYDLVSFFTQITLLYNKVQEIEENLLNLSDSKFEDLVNIFNSLLVMTDNILKTSKYHETIIRALITPYRARFVEKCQVLEHMCNSYFVVHVSSPLINDLLTFKNKEGQPENPLNTSVLIDLDGNFVATPINVVLSCIRKRLVTIMKNLVNARIKAITGNTYDESAERVERYLHIVGLIECYRFAVNYTDESKSTKTDSMFQKPVGPKIENPVFAQIKNELRTRYASLKEIEDDDSFEPAEKDILMGGIEKEIKRLKEFMKKKAIKLDNEPFEQQKVHYLKAIKRNCKVIRNVKIYMNPFIRQAILQYLFNKFAAGMFKKKLSYNYVNLFHMVGEEVYLNELLRKHKNNTLSKTLQLYSDAIAYRKFYCVEDYANNLFDYFSTVYSSLSILQKVSLLEDVAPMVIIATALKDKKKLVKLGTGTVKHMEDLEMGNDEKTFILKKNILPAETDDAFAEVAHWIEKVSLNLITDIGNHGDVDLSRLIGSLGRILLDLIANKDKIDHESLKKIKYALKNIIDADVAGKFGLDVLSKYQTIEDFSRLSKELTSGKLTLSFKLMTIHIESNTKKAEEEYEKCDQMWLKEQYTIAKHINLKRAILKFYNRNRFAKIKAKISFDFMEHNYLLITFRNLADHDFVMNNIFHLVKQNSALLQLFYEINNFLKKVVVFFFKNKLENPLDFHYIMSLLHALAKIGAQYVEFVRELTIHKQLTPEKNKAFVGKKVEVSDLEKEFEKWANTIEVKEDLEQKLKKRRIVGVKWEERALKDVLGKKANKKGAKRQQILQDKKDRIKGQK